jgi:hypothetical protein
MLSARERSHSLQGEAEPFCGVCVGQPMFGGRGLPGGRIVHAALYMPGAKQPGSFGFGPHIGNQNRPFSQDRNRACHCAL